MYLGFAPSRLGLRRTFFCLHGGIFAPCILPVSQEHGFGVEETIANYYMRVDPPDCYVLRKAMPPER